jgi:exopolysaccharide biosynthesis polyprenyl glycosylphosphotransferase
VAALRRLDLEISAGRTVRTPPPLRSLVPASDACALLVAIAVSGMQPLVIACAVLTFVVLSADTSRAYRLDPRVGEEMGWLLARLAVPLLVLAAIAALGTPAWQAAVGDLIVAGCVGALLVLVGRALAYAIGRAARARGIVSDRTLLVGSGELAVELAEVIGRHPEYGLRPVGFVGEPTAEELPHPLLGGLFDLERVVEAFEVRRLVVAFGYGNDRDLVTVLRGLERLPIEVHAVPRLFELGPLGASDTLRGIPLVHLRRPALRTFGRLSKRAFDVAVASLALVLTSPLLLSAAVAVRLSSPGPVLFRQTRVGRHGRTFEILKFRTMLVHEEADTGWAVAEQHLTAVGRVLRRTSIDELPQLVNVLRGDMSLVGPRPERPFFVERFSASVPRYEDRLRVRGGITGLAQTNGRNRELDSIPERARFDNLYVETWSLWGDILIMCRTLALLFRGDSGAREPAEDRSAELVGSAARPAP